MPNGQEVATNARGFSPLEERAELIALESPIRPITGENRSLDDSASRSTTSRTYDYLPEEGSGTSDSFSGDSSGIHDLRPEEGSGMDDPVIEEASGSPALTTEDDVSEVTTPSPISTLEDFTFEEITSTTEANRDASEKVENISLSDNLTMNVVIPVFGAITLIIVIIVEICGLRLIISPDKYDVEKPFFTMD